MSAIFTSLNENITNEEVAQCGVHCQEVLESYGLGTTDQYNAQVRLNMIAHDIEGEVF